MKLTIEQAKPVVAERIQEELEDVHFFDDSAEVLARSKDLESDFNHNYTLLVKITKSDDDFYNDDEVA